MLADTVAAALADDVGRRDPGECSFDADTVIGATIIACESLTVAGQLFVDEVFSQLDAEVIIDWYIGNGETAATDDVICKLIGRAQMLHRGERTALRFLQTLSSTAKKSPQNVDTMNFSMLFRID